MASLIPGESVKNKHIPKTQLTSGLDFLINHSDTNAKKKTKMPDSINSHLLINSPSYLESRLVIVSTISG